MLKSAMRHNLTDHKCELIPDCSYSGKTLVQKRMFPDVTKKDFDPCQVAFTFSSEEKKNYDDMFHYLDVYCLGLLSKKAVRNILEKLLPVSSVDKIWSLSDQDGDGFLDSYEWTVAIHLARRVVVGEPMPDQVVTSRIS